MQTIEAKVALSAVVLTYQSERLLRPVLESLAWCDDLVVVDSGSTDQSVAIARASGARVFDRPFDGFGEQKNFGVDRARHDWILIIDSDEIVSRSLQEEIRALFCSGRIHDASAYTLVSRFVFLGKPMRFSGTLVHPIRLYDRKRASLNRAKVHEQVETSGVVGSLRGEIAHHSYESLEAYFQKFNRYTSIGAQELLVSGKNPSNFGLVIKFFALFFRRYVLQLGILDGFRGWLWCLLSALYPVVKYLKRRELRQKGVSERQTKEALS
ncbi:MAG: hypothetical protein RJB38_947 [Pseudomonadota bacterium]|jgi:glycosyltransferase involved in cell wall biosynthesis